MLENLTIVVKTNIAAKRELTLTLDEKIQKADLPRITAGFWILTFLIKIKKPYFLFDLFHCFLGENASRF